MRLQALGLLQSLRWSQSSLLIRSPLVKIAAAVPMVGYIILYGDAFNDMFNFSSALGAEYLLFDPVLKVRMLYYGGLLIGASLLLYLWRCPTICKRIFSSFDAKDEFMRVGGASDLTFENSDVFDDEDRLKVWFKTASLLATDEGDCL